MDYYELGQRIRKFRKARGLSQEQLAEKIGISSTHMSHIETANTKLSLPVLIDIAEALEVQTDCLLYANQQENVSTAIQSVVSILESCDAKQARVIAEIIKSAKQAMDAYL